MPRASSASNPADVNPCLDCGACCAIFRVSCYCGEAAGANGGSVPQKLVSQLAPRTVSP